MTIEFWDQIDRTNTKGCWPWVGKTQGEIGVFMLDNQLHAVDRLAYEIQNHTHLTKGKDVVYHTCHNKLCCNIKHMWIGTLSDKHTYLTTQPPIIMDRNKADEIRTMYSTNKYTQHALGMLYKLSEQTIGRITRKEIWT